MEATDDMFCGVESILFREAEENIHVVLVSYASKRLDVEEYIRIQSRVEFILTTRLNKRVDFLNIVLAENGMFEQFEHELLEQLRNVWFIARDTCKLYIFENQKNEFDGLKDDLECALVDVRKKRKKRSPLRVAPVTITLVVLNLLYYMFVIIMNQSLLAAYDSNTMLSMGAMSYETIMEGAWYQIITSMFLHFGLEHLGNNMLLLAFAGYELEKQIGRWPYFVTYMLSGIIGNVASLFYYHGQGEVVVSAGASGAIYGVLGALVVTWVVNRVRRADVSPRDIIILLLITIYHGFTSTGVDNAAHIGGLFTGIVVGFLLSKISQYGKLERVNFMR